ncbi:MAG: AMP-binding protein, partial [Myxococcales bacterium]|nr:AMP-binding protein [Myxococcales bacterium]
MMPADDLTLSPDTVPGRLQRAAAQQANDAGLCFVDRHEREIEQPWPAIWAGACRAAGALAALGVAKGDRVALLLPTGLEVVRALLGCQLLGAVPFVLAPPPRLGRLDEYLARTTAQVQAAGAALMLADARAHAALAPVVEAASPPLGLHPADVVNQGPAFTPGPLDPDALALIQYSSGTTVHPKPVALTHRQIIANCDAIIDRLFAGDAAPVGVYWLPLHHDMGLIGGLLLAICGGRRLVLLPPEAFIARPAAWLRALSRHRGTYVAAPNFAYAYSAARVTDAELEGCDLSAWRVAMCGAEPIAAEVGRRFSARFARFGLPATAFAPVYGLAEATLAVTFAPFGRRVFRTTRVERAALCANRAVPGDDLDLVSVGQPLSGIAVQIRANGRACPEGEVGRIFVQSPGLMAGYFGREDTPITDGWLDTGDLGVLLDGELYVTGRAKDVVIIRGQNHMPHEIEEVTSRVPGVRLGRAAAVAELTDDGERLLLFAETTAPTPELAEAIRRAIRAAMGLDPAEVILLPAGALPRTTSGKIRRGETLRR